MTYDSTKENPIFENYVEEQKVEEVNFRYINIKNIYIIILERTQKFLMQHSI